MFEWTVEEWSLVVTGVCIGAVGTLVVVGMAVCLFGGGKWSGGPDVGGER